MIIAQISDTHIELGTPEGEQRLKDFTDTITDINALEPQPDVIIHTGDIVHNGRQDEYARSAEILAKARAPVFVMAGNKDDRANLHEAFSVRGYLAPDAGFIDYTVEDYPLRLIVLDTMTTRSNKGDFCPERVKRLINMIDADSTRPIAVFTHHPPFEVTEGPDSLHFETPDMMERLRGALQYSGRTVAVFSGHVHRAVVGTVEAIPAMTMTSIATNLRKGDYPADMQTRPVYQLHRFDGVSGITTQTRIVGIQKEIKHELASSEPLHVA